MEFQLAVHHTYMEPKEMVAAIQTALDAGKPVWIRTYTGAYGVRAVRLASNGREAQMLLGRQRNWTWITRAQLIGAYNNVRPAGSPALGWDGAPL